MKTEESKIVVFSDGTLLDKDRCRLALYAYWQLNEAEKRAFDRICEREDLKRQYLADIGKDKL